MRIIVRPDAVKANSMHCDKASASTGIRVHKKPQVRADTLQQRQAPRTRYFSPKVCLTWLTRHEVAVFLTGDHPHQTGQQHRGDTHQRHNNRHPAHEVCIERRRSH